MCGRYSIIGDRSIFAISEQFKKLQIIDAPRYNISPGSKAPIILQGKNGLEVNEATWWLIPQWSKTGKPDMRFPSFNARAETIDTSKLFAPCFKAHRCLIPADGFYEWRKISSQEKHPMCIRRRDEQPMYFGGIYSIWKDIISFSIITTMANKLMSQIHTRMPVILPERYFEQWLDSAFNNSEELKKLLIPYTDKEITMYRVSNYVSNARNQGMECMEPLEE